MCKYPEYYTAVNSIISHTNNIDEIIRLNLFETYALPMLKYACESLLLIHSQLTEFIVCWNNLFRKVFKQV